MCNYILKKGNQCNRYGKYRLELNGKEEFFCKRHYSYYANKNEKPTETSQPNNQPSLPSLPSQPVKTDKDECVELKNKEPDKIVIRPKVENPEIEYPASTFERVARDETYNQMMEMIKKNRPNVNALQNAPVPVRRGGLIFGK
jgi:hypothetical protein